LPFESIPQEQSKRFSHSFRLLKVKARHLLSPPCLKLELEMMSWDSQIRSVQIYQGLTSLEMLCWCRVTVEFLVGKLTPLHRERKVNVRRQNLAHPDLSSFLHPISSAYSALIKPILSSSFLLCSSPSSHPVSKLPGAYRCPTIPTAPTVSTTISLILGSVISCQGYLNNFETDFSL
jgi:hypothetical protein